MHKHQTYLEISWVFLFLNTRTQEYKFNKCDQILKIVVKIHTYDCFLSPKRIMRQNIVSRVALWMSN